MTQATIKYLYLYIPVDISIGRNIEALWGWDVSTKVYGDFGSCPWSIGSQWLGVVAFHVSNNDCTCTPTTTKTKIQIAGLSQVYVHFLHIRCATKSLVKIAPCNLWKALSRTVRLYFASHTHQKKIQPKRHTLHAHDMS